MDTLTSERRKLQEWVNEKDNEDLVSTALREYADFCKKVSNNPNKYLACKKEILERLEASGQNEAEASDVHVDATVSTTGDWNSVKEADTPEEGQEVEVNIAGEVIEATYKGIFSKGYNKPFAHTWLIRGEEIQNNTILWRPK